MELKLNSNYRQILKPICPLPKSEKRKLGMDLNSSVKKKSFTNKLQKLILEAPTWDEAELSE